MTLKRIIRLVGSVGVIPSLPSPQWHHTAVFSSHRFKSSLATAEKEADNATEGRKGHQSIQQTTTRQKIAKEFGEGSLFEKLEAKFERDVARIRERRERQQQAALLMSPQILDRNRNPTENAHDQTAGDGAASTKPDTTLVGRLRAKLDDTFSLERNLAERDKLWTMAFKEGYFTSAKEVLRDGQKFGEASRTLLAPERAPFLLDLKDGFVLESGSKVNLLSLVKGKVSLVTVASAGFAEPHIRTYLDPFLHEFGTLDDVQLIQVRHHYAANLLEFSYPFLPIVGQHRGKSPQISCTASLHTIHSPQYATGSSKNIFPISEVPPLQIPRSGGNEEQVCGLCDGCGCGRPHSLESKRSRRRSRN